MFALQKIVENVLYAVQYISLPDNHEDIFTQIFEHWQDPEYLENFFEENKQDLQSGYFGEIGIENAIFITLNEAYAFQQKILDIALGEDNEYSNLQEFFKPLHNYEKELYPIPEFQESKAYGGRQSWLRLYAIRIEPNLFIVTGGAIKLTRTMQERTHTQLELDRLKQVKDFLIAEGIIDNDSIIGFIEF